MPDRFAAAKLVGAVRRRRRERSSTAWTRSIAGWSAATRGLIQFFDPPFDHFDHEPGYIKGYVPGVRENGGQYTHAAIWTIMALAELGDQRAWELFRMVNPLHHGATAEAEATYKVEPYVVAADVYAVASARRPRRLDLVHRVGGLDVSPRRRIAPRNAIGRRPAAFCATAATGMEFVRSRLPLP